jgi:ataxia telangiectasia mutated family protein
MGSIGVEGTFTKASEATLSALKQNSNGLLTILSAIVSDPLYKWSLGSKKRNRPATEETDENREYKPQLENNIVAYFVDHDENRNQVAAHAIARISEKISGYEDGTLGEQQSVESQVQLLLNAAQSPDNLCCMYPGWAPWQ